MQMRGPRGAVLALLGLIAFGAVVAWFGVVKPRRAVEPAPAPSASVSPSVNVAEVPNQSVAPPTFALPTAAPASPGVSDETKAPPPPAAERTAPPAAAEKKTAPPAEPVKASGAPGPSFDIVRVEPTGESVIAGRGAPGAVIEMWRNGKSHARGMADTSGLFALVPPQLPPGSHEITLQSIAPDGTRAQSRDSMTIVIAPNGDAKPLVTLTSPDRPTVVLSMPEPPEPKKSAGAEDAATSASLNPSVAPPEPAAPAPPNADAQPPPPRPGVRIASVEAEEGGRLFVSGRAAAGATIRLYLNESFIAPGGTGSDGKVSFAIGRGLRPGEYRVRLDDVDPISGHVKSRAEVAFNMPAPLTVPLPPPAQPVVTGPASPGMAVAERSGTDAAARHASDFSPSPPGAPGPTASRDAASGRVSTVSRGAGSTPATSSVVAGMPSVGSGSEAGRSVDPGTVVVPEINTAIVARGDNLWRISRRIYGDGLRYTVIYDANQGQIRNPNKIYPGQVFVLPPEQPQSASQ